MPFGGSYEGAPLAPDAAVAAAIAPALAAARARRDAPLGVTLTRPIAALRTTPSPRSATCSPI